MLCPECNNQMTEKPLFRFNYWHCTICEQAQELNERLSNAFGSMPQGYSPEPIYFDQNSIDNAIGDILTSKCGCFSCGSVLLKKDMFNVNTGFGPMGPNFEWMCEKCYNAIIGSP